MINCSARDRGEGVGEKSGRENFAAAGGHDQDIIGPQFDVRRLSGEYLINVHGDLTKLRVSRNFPNNPRLLRLRRASESTRL